MTTGSEPRDRNGERVSIASQVRIVALSGRWFDELPSDERVRVESMIGEIHLVDEIDEFGNPWVSAFWPDGGEGHCVAHSVALAPEEMELVADGPANRDGEVLA